MALKIILKPQERLILDGAVITNGNSKSELIIENNVPLLREKDILREKGAITPCKRIYFMIQFMYIDKKYLAVKHKTYWALVKDVVEAAPSTAELLGQISEHILDGAYYPALKLAKKLIRYEEEVMKYARRKSKSLPGNPENNPVRSKFGGNGSYQGSPPPNCLSGTVERRRTFQEA